MVSNSIKVKQTAPRIQIRATIEPGAEVLKFSLGGPAKSHRIFFPSFAMMITSSSALDMDKHWDNILPTGLSIIRKSNFDKSQPIWTSFNQSGHV